MNSWDKYYKEYEGNFHSEDIICISLKDNDESLELLEKLGYVQMDGESADECYLGEFMYGCDPEENDTIDIFHTAPKNYDCNEWWDSVEDFIEKWFDIPKNLIAWRGVTNDERNQN